VLIEHIQPGVALRAGERSSERIVSARQADYAILSTGWAAARHSMRNVRIELGRLEDLTGSRRRSRGSTSDPLMPLV
jgi:hypothetical protein